LRRGFFTSLGVFLKQTPGPSPLPSMKESPAFSKARRSFASVLP